MERAPVPYVHTQFTVGNQSYYFGLSIYSNVLHMILSNNGRPGTLVMYTPHTKLGNDPTSLYTIRELLGHISTQQELFLKQIASCDIIAVNSIPFLCNLMIAKQLDMTDLQSLITEIRNFLSLQSSLILKHYRKNVLPS